MSDGVPFWEHAVERGAHRGVMGNRGLAPTPLDRIRDPNWDPNPTPDRSKGEMEVPHHVRALCPHAADFLFLASYQATVDPPWRVRISVRMAAIYTMQVLTAALAPHASIIMTNDGRSPAPQMHPARRFDFEWNLDDQPNAHQDPAAAGAERLWTPDGTGRRQ